MLSISTALTLTTEELKSFRAFAEKDNEFMKRATPMVAARSEYKELCQELSGTNIKTIATEVLNRFLDQNSCSDDAITYLQRKVSAHAERYSNQGQSGLNEAQIERVNAAVQKFASEFVKFLATDDGVALFKEHTDLRKQFKKTAGQLIVRVGDVSSAIAIAGPQIASFEVGQSTKNYMCPYKINYVNTYEVKKS